MDAPVFYDDQAPASHMYFLNTDYLFMRPAAGREFVPLGEKASTNQDAMVMPMVWGWEHDLFQSLSPRRDCSIKGGLNMYQLGIDETLVSSTCDFKLGQLGMNDGSSAVYKWVQYDTGAGSVAAVAGQVAYYYTLDGYKNNQVTSDLSDSVEIGAGVLKSTPYGWSILLDSN